MEVILFAVPRPLPQSSAPRLLPCQGNFLSPQLVLDLKSQVLNFFAKFFIEFKSKLLYTEWFCQGIFMGIFVVFLFSFNNLFSELF